MFKNCLIILFLSLSFPVFAQESESAEQAAEQLFELMEMEEMLKSSLETTLSTQMEQFSKMGMSPEGVEELKAAMLGFMLKAMAWKDLQPQLVKSYAENFTVQEMKDIGAFYNTPTGKKALKLSPKLLAEGMAIGQKRVQDRQGELQALITPIIQKHLGQ